MPVFIRVGAQYLRNEITCPRQYRKFKTIGFETSSVLGFESKLDSLLLSTISASLPKVSSVFVLTERRIAAVLM